MSIPGTDGEMENTTFLPTPLTSPALMVLASNAANSNRDEQHQMTGGFSAADKDLPVPFTSGYPIFRQGVEGFPPLYAPMHMPFMQRPILNPAGTGAFRPLGGVSGDERENYHSAFLPAKRKREDCRQFDRCSPGKESLDNCIPVLDCKDDRSPNSVSFEISSEGLSESGDSQGRRTPDEGRSLRRSSRKKYIIDGQFPCCPVCGVTLRIGEVDTHFISELEKLDKLSRNSCKKTPSREGTPQLGRKVSASPKSPIPEMAAHSRLETYQRVRTNRQGRLNSRIRGRKKRQEEATCPVCNKLVSGTPVELSDHVDQCLKKREREEDTLVDVDGNEQYEEYEWCGQTRIRASSMLDGGYKGSGFHTSSSRGDDDEDDDVNLDVDGDDSAVYGRPQYSEADVIPCNLDEPSEERERNALRGAFLKTDPVSINNSSSSRRSSMTRWSLENGVEDDCCQDEDDLPQDLSNKPSSEHGKNYSCVDKTLAATEIIESLKLKIQQQEERKTDKNKCLICMEAYNVPLVSVQCWHVHCEECWLRTLGAKKLCPQCNMITSPTDLRRVYL